MAEQTNTRASNTREVRVPGPMTASFVGLAFQISRIEEGLINMSFSTSPAMRKKVKNLNERYQRLINMVDEEITVLAKDAEVDRRRDDTRRNGKDTARPNREPVKGSGPVQAQAATDKTTAKRPNQGQGNEAQRVKQQDSKQPQPQTAQQPNSQKQSQAENGNKQKKDQKQAQGQQPKAQSTPQTNASSAGKPAKAKNEQSQSQPSAAKTAVEEKNVVAPVASAPTPATQVTNEPATPAL